MTGRRGPTGPDGRGGTGRRGTPARPGGRGPSAASPGKGDAVGGSGPSEPEGLERLRRAALSGARTPPSLVARGTLRRLDVEGRPLVLDADDGATWELLLPAGWVLEAEPGARVTVSGDPVSGDRVSGDRVSDVAGASSAGRVLRVRSLSRGD